MGKLESLQISVEEFSVTDLSPLFDTPHLNYIDICRYTNDGSEIALDENLTEQIEELKATKPNAYNISIMEK